MKRLYLVGKSRDNKRLYFARTKGAKRGSFELPISRKLVRLIDEAEATRAGAGARSSTPAPTPPASTPAPAPEARRPVPPRRQAPQPAAAARAGVPPDVPVRVKRVRPPGPDEGELAPALGPRARPAAPTPSGAERITPAPSEPLAAPEPVAPPGPSTDGRVARKAVQLAPSSRLSPAEIQSLLREGRTVRSVAKEARAPLEWVQRLAKPIEDERLGIVNQLLRARVYRPRKGRSAETVGVAIIENLRERGMRFPEKVLDDGWTAVRPAGREWRIRFSFEHRGKRRRADWSFDPQTREVETLNAAASDLSFRGDPAEGSTASGDDDGDGRARRTAPRARTTSSARSTSKRSSTAAKRTAAKTGAKAAAKKTSSRRSTRGR